MNLKYKQIQDCFTDLQKLKTNGIWFSGYKREGEYKEWTKNGKLEVHRLYKDGKVIKKFISN